MQAVLHFAPSSTPLFTPFKTSTPSWKLAHRPQITFRCPPVNVTVATYDNPAVDYNSKNSVFPAEACETIGGEACDAEMYPEVKLKPETKNNKTKATSELVDREYLEYDGPKTVFPAEACDDLGGEFCEPEYQSGVYK
ncbi:light-regulated protein, chloroplastic [Cornus florida]|uniref:light-regulated protein, chloroplastic n=1 Tax=Cornus florida TaxID=4283 RepID=UPI00289808F9|nr:light-regulated protein, chloroplastic [Cornus florida]